jgi:effector-binding domain-containing protein
MEVRIDIVEPSLIAVVAGPFDLSRLMPSWDAVYSFLRGTDTDVRQTGQNVAMYHRGQRMEIGVEVDRAFEPHGEVTSSTLPGGRVAHATHTTGYGDMHCTYSAIETHCAEHDLATTGTTWEVYGDPDADDHVDVEIYFLLS